MAKGDWWFKFDFRVWRTDSSLRRCSIETRGVWLEILCVMHETGECSLTGTYEELGRVIGCETSLVARSIIELERTKTADVTNCNDEVTVTSRRLKRELTERESTRLRVRRHRETKDVTPVKRDRVKSNKKEVKKEGEKEDATASLVTQVFEHWQCTCSKQNFDLTPARERLIKLRLKDKFTVEQLKQAINIAQADPFYQGKNNRNTEYLDFKTIFKTREKVEEFLYSHKGNGQITLSEEERRMRDAVTASRQLTHGK